MDTWSRGEWSGDTGVLLKLTGRLNVVDDPISSEEERPCVDGELE